MPTQEPPPAGGDVSSLAETTRALTTFLAAGTFVHALLEVFTPFAAQTARRVEDVPVETWALFGVIAIFTLRFFYGNARYVDCFFAPLVGMKHPVRLGVDLAFIVVESLLLFAGSFFVNDVGTCFAILLTLMAVELLWFLIVMAREAAAEETESSPARDSRLRNSEVNNFVALGALAIAYLIAGSGSEVALVIAGGSIALVNSAIDFGINGRFYFG